MWPRVAAWVLVVGAIAFLAVLFSAGQTQSGAMVPLIALGVSWLVAAVLTLRYVWSTNPAQVRRAALRIVGFAATSAAIVAILGLIEGDGLQTIAEETVLFVVVAASIATPFVLAWAVLTVRPAADPDGTESPARDR